MKYNYIHKIKFNYFFSLLTWAAIAFMLPIVTNGQTPISDTNVDIETKCFAPESKYIRINQQGTLKASVRWQAVTGVYYYNVEVTDNQTNTSIFNKTVNSTKIDFPTITEDITYHIQIRSICMDGKMSDWRHLIYRKNSSPINFPNYQGIQIVDNDTLVYGTDVEPNEEERDTLDSSPINTLEADLDTEVNEGEGLENDSLIRTPNILDHESNTEIKNVLSLDSTITKHSLTNQATNNHARVSQSTTAISFTTIDEYEANLSLVEQADWRTFTNPFTHQIRLEYSVSEANTPINIYLYNTNGQIVATLLNNTTKNQGTHHLEYDAATLPKGIYLAILQTLTKQKIIKLIKSRD